MPLIEEIKGANVAPRLHDRCRRDIPRERRPRWRTGVMPADYHAAVRTTAESRRQLIEIDRLKQNGSVPLVAAWAFSWS